MVGKGLPEKLGARCSKVSRYYLYVTRFGDTKYDNTRRLCSLLL